MSAKADVRKLIRALPPMSVHEREESSRRICEAIRNDPGWKAARLVASFAPQASEPDIEPLWEALDGRILSYPRVEEKALQFFRVTQRNGLVTGRWNVREPAADENALVAPAEFDLVLVPGMAFTPDGARLGRGGGYYDRFLAHPDLHARKLGICFARQLIESLPTEPHDQRVDRVVAA